MTSLENYRWTVRFGLALSDEYTKRFGGKIHKTTAVLKWLLENEPDLPPGSFTTPQCAMPDEYLVYRGR